MEAPSTCFCMILSDYVVEVARHAIRRYVYHTLPEHTVPVKSGYTIDEDVIKDQVRMIGRHIHRYAMTYKIRSQFGRDDLDMYCPDSAIHRRDLKYRLMNVARRSFHQWNKYHRNAKFEVLSLPNISFAEFFDGL